MLQTNPCSLCSRTQRFDLKCMVERAGARLLRDGTAERSRVS